jgi:hypothetical protein
MMNNKMNNPARFTGEMYGTKVAVEYDHSDIALDEVMDAFETLMTGLGYHKDAWKNWIVARAEEYKEEDNQSEDFGDWDSTLEDGLEDETFDVPLCKDPRVIKIIDLLNDIDVDGEVMQFILEQVGLDEQMAIQLATMYPDVVEEHIEELKAEGYPFISDNFQIGPDGAYEHEDDDEDDEYSQPNQAFINAFQNYIKTMKANTKNGK